MDASVKTGSESDKPLNSMNLSGEQMALLKEIGDKFDSEGNAADINILYEVTGFQSQAGRRDRQHWWNYADFHE